MGTEFKITLYSPDEASASRASAAAFARIAALDAAFSDYNPDSELMRLCDRAGGPAVPVGEDLFDVLTRSPADVRADRRGLRRHRRPGRPPSGDAARRDRKLPRGRDPGHGQVVVGYEMMTLDPAARTVRLAKPGMKLDLGGIAKGYASEAAVRVLKREGITSALVSGAGDVVASGPSPGTEGWTVAVGALTDPSTRHRTPVPPP